MRHAWEPEKVGGEAVGPFLRLLLPPLLSRLRREDALCVPRVDRFLTNSSHVANRIRKYYRRSAIVVHPPVAVGPFLACERSPGDAYLVVSRLVPYKRVDLAVAACSRLGRPLVVIGDGRSRERLETMAGPTVSFLGYVCDRRLREQMASCRALLFPGEEDFGMVPVEAQAAGLPVIAYGAGGALETVVDGRTGVFFREQTLDSLCEAIKRFERLSLDPGEARRQALAFGPERFDREFERAVALGPEDVRSAEGRPMGHA